MSHFEYKIDSAANATIKLYIMYYINYNARSQIFELWL